MAKNTDETPKTIKPTRLQLSRYEREQRTRKFVVIGAAAVAGLVILMVLLAVLQIRVWEPSRVVARVGSETVSVSQLQQRMKFEQAAALQQYQRVASQVSQMQQQGSSNDQNNFLLQFYQQQLQQLVGRVEAGNIASTALDNLINESLIRQESSKRGIKVSDAEVQQEVEKTFGLYRQTLTPFPTDTAVPTSTPAPTNTPTQIPPTATATPTATNTPSPTATSTNTPAPTATATAATTSTQAVSNTVALTDTASVSTTAATTATVSATQTSIPAATATAAATATPAATATSIATATAAVSDTAAVTATVAVTPTETVVFPTATPRLQPTTVTEDDFKVLLDRTLQSYSSIGFTEADYRNAVANSLYQERLKEAIAKEVPTEAKHYRYDYVRFNSEDLAKVGLDKLNAGSISMEALISETNNITQPAPAGTGATATDQWVSQFTVEQQSSNSVLAALESGEIGKPSAIISATSNGQPGFFVVVPRARETRKLEESELKQMQDKAYSDWLEKTRTDANIVKREIEPITVIPPDVKRTSDTFIQQMGGAAPQ